AWASARSPEGCASSSNAAMPSLWKGFRNDSLRRRRQSRRRCLDMRVHTEALWDISKLPQPKAAIEAGDLQAALSGFATRELLDYRLHGPSHSDVWVCGFGVALWLMGDTDGAGRIWSRATGEALKGKFKYSSTGTFESGLLLWFASVWLKDEDWHEQAAAL